MNFNILKTKISHLYIAIRFRDTWKKLQKCDVLFIMHDASYGYIYEDKKYSTILDSARFLYEKNGYKCESISRGNSKLVGKECYYQPSSFNSSNFLYGVLNRFIKLFFNINLFKKLDLWKKILERSNPSIVIAIRPSSIVCQACYSMKVKVYDLQHGAIESSMRLYANQYQKNELKEFSPSGFLVWDEASKEKLLLSEFSEASLVVVGHPFLYRFMRRIDNDYLVEKSFLSYDDSFNFSKPNVLISIQWAPMMKIKTGFNLLPEAMLNVIKETMNDYNYYIRAHPVNQKEQLYYLEEEFGQSHDKVNYIEATNIPLPTLLAKMNLHITYYSAVTIEASLYGIQTILLNPELRKGKALENLFRYQIDNGLAELVEINELDIKNSIENKLSQENIYVRDLDTEEVLIALLSNSKV